MIRIIFVSTALTLLTSLSALAEVCDYKPSRLKAVAAGGLAGGAAAGGGAAMSAAGYYSLVHAGSGLTMLGSTAAGTSAAGTVGIIAGTGGALGTIGAVLLSPITITVGAAAAAGGAAYEGFCYFQVERITDAAALQKILGEIAEYDETATLVKTRSGDALRLELPDGPHAFLLENLYVADGRLMHRDWGPNTDLGPIVLVAPNEDR